MHSVSIGDILLVCYKIDEMEHLAVDNQKKDCMILAAVSQ